jgi:spore germination protein
MVGQLNTRETLLLCLLRGDKVRGALTITIPGTKSNSLTSKASISVALVKRKCDVQRKATTGLKFFIDLKLEAQIEYYDGPSLLGNDVINRLTEALRKDIEYESYKLLCKFQKLKIDPVQLGRDAKSKHYDYVTKRWRELIPMSSYEVHSDVIIRRFGLRD